MTEADKKIHLENLLFKIDNLYISESSIRNLSNLIRDEQRREINSKNISKLYSNNLSQTIEKNLEDLEKNASKPKIRIELFKDCVSNFKQDINRELSDLKYR
ncbi:hypothetical protein [Flavobacterium chungbukense]|uniref:Uncharacterized protein n=1 Tax=Flavobacterium chungbukense TaxID=877464 RepID=A0ABP7XVE5_9FLAO|nr:hypothetical protein [Flavobacterium chungbukense]MCC4921602.1 hypothetical protein [Flavobacterium chungbukense]